MIHDQNTLQDLAVFVEVARQKNFSRASETLGISAATASRRILTLEKECGASLFNRTTRRVELTERGATFFAQCNPIVDAARQAREQLREQTGRITGPLRVSMPTDFGALILGPMLTAFAHAYPGVQLQMDLSPAYRDLVQDNFDVVLRMGTSQDKGLVHRRVAVLEQGLFASPAYLRRHGALQHPDELPGRACIFAGGESFQATWPLSREGVLFNATVQGRFSVNNQSLMRVLAEQDMGIALLESSLTQTACAAGRLVRILPDWSPPRIAVYAVTTSRLRSAVVKAFTEFLAERFL